MKTVILVRHAKAMDRDKAKAQGIGEAARPLTEKGRTEFQKHVRRTRELFDGADLFVTSPYLRAADTLNLLLEGLELPQTGRGRARTVTSPLLEPEEDPARFLQWLQKRPEKCIVAVSHEPFLSDFTEEALRSAIPFLKIRKGAVIVMQWRGPEKGFRLLQLAQPLG